MTALLATKTARRRGIAFVLLLAVCLLMMAFSGNPAVRELQHGVIYAFQPMQRALDGIAGGAASIVGALSEIDRLHADNASLRDENDRLTAENARLREIGRENEVLTGLLQLRNGFEYKTAAAQVVARESSEFRRVVTIDRGSDAGIKPGDVVIAQGGALAGRVTDVGPNFANVLLITDPNFRVIGQFATSAGTGEVTGQLDVELVMSKIDSTVRIQLDEEVFTAGIELSGGVRSPYPKGLLIGQVIDVRRDANDVVQTAYLQPAADADKLEYVLVVLNYVGGLPPLEEQPSQCGPEPSQGTLPDGEVPCVEATPSPPASAAVSPAASALPAP